MTNLHVQSSNLTQENEMIEKSLNRAIHSFQKVDCSWGLGISYYQYAVILNYKYHSELPLSDNEKGRNLSNSTVNENIHLLTDSISKMKDANTQFSKINHLIGMAQANKTLASLLHHQSGITSESDIQREIEIKLHEENSKKYR